MNSQPGFKSNQTQPRRLESSLGKSSMRPLAYFRTFLQETKAHFGKTLSLGVICYITFL